MGLLLAACLSNFLHYWYFALNPFRCIGCKSCYKHSYSSKDINDETFSVTVIRGTGSKPSD